MAQRTLTRILDMVYDSSPESWERMAFTCAPETYRELRSLDEIRQSFGDTRRKRGAPPTMLGFPVHVKAGHKGLSFGVE